MSDSETTTRRNATFPVLAAVAGALATLVAQHGIYGALITPRLAGWKHVPLVWWVFACSPIVLTALALTVWHRKRWFAAAAFVTIGFVSVNLAGDIYSVSHGLPVDHDSFDLDAYYFTFFFVRSGLVFVLLVFLTWLVALPALLRGTSAA